ncbi:MAG: 4Fe-4S binding protein [Spirochaetes bacterium]|nr:4Fe-4S binding protein [Spirochaetota bacterium]
MLIETGIPGKEDLAAVSPPAARIAKGPVAVIECFQEIPCNPCVDACKAGAITKAAGINDLPKLDFDKCNGCGLCITQCPGLAIFVVDGSYSETHSVVRLPYEFVPVPEKGQFACALDRAGEERGWFEVVRVASGGAKNKTTVLWLSVPKELAMEVRGVKIGGFKNERT